MNQNQFRLAFMSLALFMFNSCSDSEDETDLCTNGPEITVDNTITSIEGEATGEITVSASGGTSPYMFSIDGTNFQNSETFSELGADDYTITVKDANECTDSELISIAEVPEVFYANQIRPIIDANCQISGCHGSNANISSWATYDDVRAGADRIKERTSNKTMPPGGPLSDANIKLIADWVDIGAPNN